MMYLLINFSLFTYNKLLAKVKDGEKGTTKTLSVFFYAQKKSLATARLSNTYSVIGEKPLKLEKKLSNVQ